LIYPDFAYRKKIDWAKFSAKEVSKYKFKQAVAILEDKLLPCTCSYLVVFLLALKV